jgi:phosphate transport system permease protein
MKPDNQFDNSITTHISENLRNRKQKDSLGNAFFRLSTLVGVIALGILLLTIINQAFGLVAEVDKVDRTTLISSPVETLSKSELVSLIENNLSPNRVRTLDRDTPLVERSLKDLRSIVENDVFQTQIVASSPLLKSVFSRQVVIEKMTQEFPQARIKFRSWLSWQFITSTMSNRPEQAGVRTAIFGSFFVILIAILVAFPLGVSTAIYLEEYARSNSRLGRLIQTNIDNLAGVPSIIYGILGLAIFVRALEPITSGRVFGADSANARTVLSAGLTMALLILPILITNAQEAIKAVPNSIKLASYGLGATQWQTIWYHVLPSAMPGVLTGTILAVSRALGETAPLIIIGAATYITKDPTGLFSNFTAMPIQIYNWTTRPQTEFRNLAAAAILVLLVMLLTINAAAIIWRNRIYKNR